MIELIMILITAVLCYLALGGTFALLVFVTIRNSISTWDRAVAVLITIVKIMFAWPYVGRNYYTDKKKDNNGI